MVTAAPYEVREWVDIEEPDISDSRVLRFAKATAVIIGLERARKDQVCCKRKFISSGKKVRDFQVTAWLLRNPCEIIKSAINIVF